MLLMTFDLWAKIIFRKYYFLSIFNKMIATGLSNSVTRYNPYLCIGIVLLILFILWVFYGGKQYDFIGLAPLDPVTHVEYTGSLYSWGNQVPPTEQTNVPDRVQPTVQPIEQTVSLQDISAPEMTRQNDSVAEISAETPLYYQNVCPHSSPRICQVEAPLQDRLIIDETPALPPQFGNEVPRAPLPKIRDKRLDKRLPSKGERLCCQTMERIYGMPFKSIWPSWLRNPETGAEMELDCFNDDLKIAVEYNGVQHYQWPNFTNQSYEQFMNQVRRDDLKKRICDRHGVYLITVPYNVPHDKIPEYITLYLPETIKNRIHEEDTLHDIN